MVDISKMVEDGKQSPHARGAFVFYLQNIANLVRSMPSGARAELAGELHARAEDMASVVFGHHFATAPAAPVVTPAEESQRQTDLQPGLPAIEEGHAVPINPPGGSEETPAEPVI